MLLSPNSFLAWNTNTSSSQSRKPRNYQLRPSYPLGLAGTGDVMVRPETGSPASTPPSGATSAADRDVVEGSDFMVDYAAADPLRQVFVDEASAATAQCAACGHTATLAEASIYAQAPGLVVRCRSCNNVMMRLVIEPQGQWLDLRGLQSLTIRQEARS